MSEAERIEWESRHIERGVALKEPEPFIVSAVAGLGRLGTALDLAGGTGRHSLWLAAQGWTTTLVDIAPAALEMAADQAALAGFGLNTVQHDLDDGLPAAGPVDLVVIHHYLNRHLLGEVSSLLFHGGHLVMAHPTVANLERNERPGRRFLLEPGELPDLLGVLKVVTYFEGWTAQGRHEAQLVAQRPHSDGPGR